MAIGDRIRFFRKLRGMTSEELGKTLGYTEKTAHVRVSQYENGSRGPKKELVDKLADIFDVSPEALYAPDIDSYDGLMHTLFAIEEMYGLHVDDIEGEICLRLDKQKGQTYVSLFNRLYEWYELREKLKSGEIEKDDYDRWRYKYPEEKINK